MASLETERKLLKVASVSSLMSCPPPVSKLCATAVRNTTKANKVFIFYAMFFPLNKTISFVNAIRSGKNRCVGRYLRGVISYR